MCTFHIQNGGALFVIMIRITISWESRTINLLDNMALVISYLKNMGGVWGGSRGIIRVYCDQGISLSRCQKSMKQLVRGIVLII